MKSAKKVVLVMCVFFAIITLGNSCKKFDVLNTDPNSITPSVASPDYLMANVLTQSAMWYGNYGSGIFSGAMQQTYQDAFGNTFSGYQWGPESWAGNYSILRDNKLLLQKAQTNDWKFHQGVALTMRAFNFGNIADVWGDAPDSMALNGDQNGSENLYPAFDSQEAIYARVIADLQAAVPLLDGSTTDHPEITGVTMSSDVFYGGDPAKWQKLAYSLLLRYYMRVSSKMDVKANVEAIASKVIADNDGSWVMPLPGADQGTSYQFCSKFNGPSGYNRNKMCGTLTMKLKALKDPRIVIMAEPVVTRSVVDAAKFAPGDNTTLLNVVNGIRYINPAAAAASKFKQFDTATYAQDRPYGAVAASIYSLYDTSARYVGIPISYSNFDFEYNINGTGTQSTSLNDYVSYLRRDIYDNPTGDLLNQKLLTYSEVCFDLAEAALKGWNVNGTAEDWYNKGVQASFDTWKVFSDYQSDVNDYYGCVKDFASYIAQPSVKFNNTLQRIIEQKWIASWQACNEAFMDWRRTGYPTLNVGWASYRGAIPLRFAYDNTELQNNAANGDAAIAKLKPSSYVGTDGNNSSWSKFWLVDGTGKPW
ncbi:MAG: SusD/RagB family nutrient-binding outer rane lipoprotein [Ferruginibacter sp.]|uniref:SusD/RagB family nutrient-binding outer membrane lipoprotein n=1 Tax=Ferruginibacter sp. TaxID=1940288 RepID=UPI002657DFDC|nr:SusD/RagB family nutrient-binding outer membrane lipoprotein [Ferruginibacter sp.]MDB5276796.1 SusD/RagB family nutrient-binding outer rane lipoprotein [Ferruginibacter sp.]